MIKKNTLVAVLASAALFSTAVFAEATVYGQARVFLANIDKTDGTVDNDAWALESEASRIGFKGSQELEYDMEVIYQFEYEVDPVEGDGIAKNRNSYIGLKNDKFGKIFFGKHDTPLKKSQGKVDLFSDYEEADMKQVLEGERRLNNMIYYASPKIANAVHIHFSAIPGEDFGNNSEQNGIADTTSIAAFYKADDFYVAAAFDDDDDDNSIVRLVGQYKLDQGGIGAILQTVEENGEDFSDDMLISAYFNAAPNVKLKAQWVSRDQEDDVEATQFTAGVDYTLGQDTTLAGYFTSREEENANGTTIEELDLIGVGLIHKF